jgi:uncharacterized protein (DUF697 family)
VPSSSTRPAEAAAIVRHYTILCAEANWVPWWWVASPSIAALQLKMLAEISRVYGIELTQNKTMPLAASLGGGGLSFLISRHPFSLGVKAWILSVPVLGIPLRLGIGPAIMASYTWLLGRAFISHYETGGTYEDFDVSMVSDELRRALGTRWARAQTA